ncbi:MAG: hypothetical protein MUC51_14290 [Anaerolineae bacterium]|nr:hypothetical protein [Anaerolineae bacterium]
MTPNPRLFPLAIVARITAFPTRLLLAALLAAVCAGAAGVPPVQAAGVVSTCNEASLVAALAGGGTVTFSCSGTITLASTITISTDTTLDGAGQTVTIHGNDAVRVFYVNSGVTFNLQNLTVSHGSATAGGGIYNAGGTVNVINSTVNYNISTATSTGGGGIYNAGGTLNVTNSTLDSNRTLAQSSHGGGIYNAGGTLNVTNSTLDSNRTLAHSSHGGGIWNSGVLNVTDSVIRGNSCDANSHGGGIYQHSSGRATLTRVTLSGNSARYAYGGGVYSVGTLILTNVTLSENTAHTSGGLYAAASTSNATLTNVTVSGNTAPNGVGGITNNNRSQMTIRNSILWGNTGTTHNEFFNETIAGTVAAISNSVVQGGCPADTTCSNIVTADPKLGALANNGGSTQTRSLGTDSAAIDAGNNALCPATDQRSQPRNDMGCDVGAYELQYTDSASVSRAISTGGAYTFGPALAKVQVANAGTCTGLAIQRVTGNHAQATIPNLQTGAYWTITPVPADCSGFNVTLGLPALAFTPDGNSKVCRWDTTASQWSCGPSADNAVTVETYLGQGPQSSVQRQNVTAFSDWVVGNMVGPTAVTLVTLGARGAAPSPFPVGVPLALAGLAVGCWLARSRRPLR